MMLCMVRRAALAILVSVLFLGIVLPAFQRTQNHGTPRCRNAAFVQRIITDVLDGIVDQERALPRSAVDLRLEIENSSQAFRVRDCVVEYRDVGDGRVLIELSEFDQAAHAIGYRHLAPYRFALTPRLLHGHEDELSDRAERTGP